MLACIMQMLLLTTDEGLYPFDHLLVLLFLQITVDLPVGLVVYLNIWLSLLVPIKHH